MLYIIIIYLYSDIKLYMCCLYLCILSARATKEEHVPNKITRSLAPDLSLFQLHLASWLLAAAFANTAAACSACVRLARPSCRKAALKVRPCNGEVGVVGRDPRTAGPVGLGLILEFWGFKEVFSGFLFLKFWFLFQHPFRALSIPQIPG